MTSVAERPDRRPRLITGLLLAPIALIVLALTWVVSESGLATVVTGALIGYAAPGALAALAPAAAPIRLPRLLRKVVYIAILVTAGYFGYEVARAIGIASDSGYDAAAGYYSGGFLCAMLGWAERTFRA